MGVDHAILLRRTIGRLLVSALHDGGRCPSRTSTRYRSQEISSLNSRRFRAEAKSCHHFLAPVSFKRHAVSVNREFGNLPLRDLPQFPITSPSPWTRSSHENSSGKNQYIYNRVPNELVVTGLWFQVPTCTIRGFRQMAFGIRLQSSCPAELPVAGFGGVNDPCSSPVFKFQTLSTLSRPPATTNSPAALATAE